MAKRYRIQASDGKWESMNEDMFDYNVLVFLNRITRRPPTQINAWASRFEVTRAMYARPNARTFDNVFESLKRSTQRGDVKRDGDYFQIVRRSR